MLPGILRCWAAYTGDSWSSKRRFILHSCSGMHYKPAKAPAPQPERRSRREPRTQRGGPGTARAQARRSGPAASSATTKRSQARVSRLAGREGGRETLRGEGEGGRWRNRLCRLYRRGRFSVTREIPPTLPARPAEGRLNLAPPRDIVPIRQRGSQSPRRAGLLPPPSLAGRGERAARLLHAPIGGERP